MRAALSGVTDYWESSRKPRYSLLFVLPLVVAYEALAAMLSYEPGSLRNGADVLLRSLFQFALGNYGPLALGVILAAVCIWLVARDMRASRGDLRVRVILLMAIESAMLAAVFGIVVGLVTAQLLGALSPLVIGIQESLTTAELLMLSLGAGVYEELLFRVLLVSGLTLLFGTVFGWTRTAAAVASVLVAASVFSLFHYIPPLGDPFQVQSFLFRLVAGVFFSALFVLRGFGITAWTHALYDVYLLV